MLINRYDLSFLFVCFESFSFVMLMRDGMDLVIDFQSESFLFFLFLSCLVFTSEVLHVKYEMIDLWLAALMSWCLVEPLILQLFILSTLKCMSSYKV